MDSSNAVRVHAGFAQEFPGTSASAAEVMLNLVRTGMTAVACLQRFLAAFDLAPQPFNVLAILGGAGGTLNPHEISERLLVPRSTLTSVLDGLERRGLIARQQHPGHRGMVDVAITAQGIAVLEDLLPHLHAHETEWFAWLAEADRQKFIDTLGDAHAAFLTTLSEPTAPAKPAARGRTHAVRSDRGQEEGATGGR